MNSAITSEVHSLKTELDKVRREKLSASGLASSLKRDLSSKESDIAKLTREIEGLKIDSRDKDLRLQSVQSKVIYTDKTKNKIMSIFCFQLNLLRDRTRAEEDRHNKEKDQVNLDEHSNVRMNFLLI